MRPTDVLAYRRILYDQARENLRHEPADADRDQTAEYMHDGYVDTELCTSQGEPYYVSTDMCAVATAAAKALPDEELRVGDLPSSVGFLVYDRPIRSDDEGGTLEGVMWREFSEGFWSEADDESNEPPHTRRGVRIYPLARGTGANQLFPLITYNHPGYGPTAPMEWEYNTWASHNDHGVVPTDDNWDIAPILRATWTIMQQSLSVSVRTQVDRAERRRSARAGLASDVLVVRLRRQSLDGPAGDDETEPVPWSHRWLVSGHWRNQWLPSRACHRLQWIGSYVKGPESKPLVVKNRVTAWVR